MLEEHGDDYDPFVARRIRTGAEISDDEQHARYAERNRLAQAFEQEFVALAVDALIYPTVGCIPPAIAETDDADEATRVNLRCLRNTATVNHYNGCAISLPCHAAGEAPVGLMLCMRNGDDEKLYQVAQTVEMIMNEARL